MTGFVFVLLLCWFGFVYLRTPKQERARLTHPRSVINIGDYRRKYMAQQGKFVLDNLTFDLITVLHEKSKGLEAYEKYVRDAQGNDEVRQIFEQIRQDDQRHIEQLQQHLGRVLGNVKRAA